MFFLLNAYTTPSLLALAGSLIVILLIVRDALIKKRLVRTGLTALIVTPFMVALIYLVTTWSWITLILQADFRTERILYSGKLVILLHIAASLGRAFLPATWFPSGLIGGMIGCGCGILAGLGRHWRAQATTTASAARLSKRAFLLGVPVALGLLAAPEIVLALSQRRSQISLYPSTPSHATTPGTTVAQTPRINSVALSPDGSRVAFGDNSGLLQVWDIQPQKLSFTCHSQAALIESVAWSPDGKHLASSGGDRLDIWDAQSGALLTTYTGKTNSDLFPLSWSPDGKYIAASDHWGGRIYVWLLANKSLLYTCDGCSMSWSPDSRYLVTGSGPNSPLVAWVRDAQNGKLLFTYQGLSQGIAGQGANFSDVLAWSPDNKRIALGVADTLHIWDALDGENVQQYQTPNLDALVWLPDGLIVSGDNDGEVKSWNTSNSQTIQTYRKVDINVAIRAWSLTSTPDGKYIAAAFLTSPKNIVQVWETQSGKQLFQYGV